MTLLTNSGYRLYIPADDTLSAGVAIHAGVTLISQLMLQIINIVLVTSPLGSVDAV